MEVFRARRTHAAQTIDAIPGINITYKVDGRVAKRRNDRNDEGRHTQNTQESAILRTQTTQRS